MQKCPNYLREAAGRFVRGKLYVHSLAVNFSRVFLGVQGVWSLNNVELYIACDSQ
jgi:hypothetical protein